MCEPDNINKDGPLEDIVLAYNHPSIKEIQRRDARDTNMFKFIHVPEIDVFRKLFILNTRNVSGYNQQPPHLLKLSAHILSYTLLPIIKNAFE